MDSAILKIQRAEDHYATLNELLNKERPFGYFIETNFKSGQRATFAKRNEEVANKAAIIIGELIHSLRAALDHTYWACTEQFAQSNQEKRHIQFPIKDTEDKFKKFVTTGLCKRLPESFTSALASLRPYREDGNTNLCLVHDLDIVDKHKSLIPTGDFTRISSSMIKQQVPDFPPGLSNCGFGSNGRDVVWNVPPMPWAVMMDSVVEKELDVPVEIVLADVDSSRPVLEVLQEMIVTTEDAHKVLRSAV